MKGIKKFFNQFVLSFALICAFVCGIAFLTMGRTDKQNIDAAATYEDVSNILPPYFVVTPEEGITSDNSEGAENQDLFLMAPGKKVALSMTNGFVKNNADDDGGENPAYFPDLNDKETFYYFGRFENTLSLYYNLTNKDVQNGIASDSLNLLKGKETSLFVQEGEFAVQSYDVMPSRFELSFSLDTTKSGLEFSERKGTDIHDFEGTNITLDKEGCYTLVIPYTYLYAEKGEIINSAQGYIYYTFMVFNSTTYLDQSTQQPNTQISSFVQTSVLTNSTTYSRYYFYNFDDNPGDSGDKTNTAGNMPKFSYNPSLYDITIEYTDINEEDEHRFFTFTLQPAGEGFALQVVDENDQPISVDDCPVKFNSSSETQADLYFNELGVYDISFGFVSRNGEKVYKLPFECKKQRLYVFGYQALYTTTERDQNNMTKSKELKKFGADADVNFGQYAKSADITSMLDLAPAQRATSVDDYNDILNGIKSKLESPSTSIQPISTNMTPVKFKSNAHVSPAPGQSYYWEVKEEENDGAKVKKIDDASKKSFVGDNFTKAGTYLVVVIYNFQDFLTETGTNAGTYFHYQVFYFTITDFAPSVSIKDENGNDIYGSGYTNKDVYIIDNSAVADYEAEVRITLSAQDYSRGQNTYFFRDINIKDFPGAYEGITYKEDLGGKFAGKPGVHISTDSQFHNAKFEIKIFSSNSVNPSEVNFTIDTNEIGSITARNVSFISSSEYLMSTSVPDDSNLTNQPMIFMWNEKASRVPTHAYYRFFPIVDTEYYHTEDPTNSNVILLKSFLQFDGHNGILPTNNMLDLQNGTDWQDYSNAIAYTDSSTIPSTFVRSKAGLYLFEIFDEAGNYHFEAFLLDDTAPVFVKYVASNGSTTLSLLSTSETLTVSETDTYKILWGSKKGLYIAGLNDATSDTNYLPSDILGHYSLDGIEFGSENPLKDYLYKFFGKNTSVINNVESVSTPSGSGITSYNSRYITIDMLKETYIQQPTPNTPNTPNGYLPYNTLQPGDNIHSWDIKQIRKNDKGEDEANEGAYKFLVRDMANTKVSSPNSPSANAFRQAPSAHLTINITSDSSRMTLFLGDNPENSLTLAGYSPTGKFYQGDTVASDADLHKNQATADTESTYSYKYQYYSPINTSLPITLSYIPYASNGSQIATLKMEYYPFVKASEDFYNAKHADKSTYNAYAYFYTISQVPTRTQTIFELTPQNEGSIQKDEGNGESALHYDLATSGNLAAPGKYVFTRKYVISESAEIDKYDFYERTLTLIVDRFDLISSRETIEHGDDISTESYVGGDVMITMYSEATQTNISIAYPYYDEGTGLNKGSLFSSSSSTMNEKNDPSIALTTNKMPVALNVPKYKFTRYNAYNASDNSYAVQINNELSYYGGYAWEETVVEDDGDSKTTYDVFAAAVFKEIMVNKSKKIVIDRNRSLFCQSFDTKEEAQSYINAHQASSSIAEYEIYAKVKFTPLANPNSTIWYRSNGETTDGEFLKFFRVDGLNAENKDFSGTPETEIKNFTTPGTYVVTLYQANGQSAATEGDAAFNRLYKFSFRIESGRPDFDVLNENEIMLDSMEINNETRYYTNSKTVRVQWTDDPSPYMAKIDKGSIKLDIFDGDKTLPNQTLAQAHTAVVDSNDNQTHYFDYTFENWKNDNYIRVSMTFEGYDKYPNLTASKYIYVDYTAPFERLASLMDKTAAATTDPTTHTQYFSRLFQESNMRTLYLADNRTRVQTDGWTADTFAQEMEKVSYSYSAGDGTYRSYSYMVGKDFFENAYQALTSGTQSPTSAQNMYVKALGNSIDLFETYEQTTKESFNPRDTRIYTSLKEVKQADFDSTFSDGQYYEIVEVDLAGNMVVYIVYVQSPTPESDIAISYTNTNKIQKDEDDERISTAEIVNGFNIYSNTGFKITGLNYNNDAWGLYRVTINRITTTYMLSPWLKTGDIYRLGSGAPTPVSFEDIFAGIGESRTKQSMMLADRISGNPLEVKISIMDGSLNTRHYSTSDTATLEILDVPTLAQVNSNTAYVFPKTIKIAYWTVGGWNWTLLGEDGITNLSNDPTAWATLAAEKTDLATFDYTSGNLVINIKIAKNVTTRFKYVIIDNFGYTLTELQDVNETQFDEVTGKSTIYEFTESDLSKTYLSDDEITFYFNAGLYNAKVYKTMVNGTTIENPNITPSAPNNNISSIKLAPSSGQNNYDLVYFIQLFENGVEDQQPIRLINLRVYNNLPAWTDKVGEQKPDENNVWFLDKNNKPIMQDDLDHFTTSVVFDGKPFSGQVTSVRTFSNTVTMFVDDGQVAAQDGKADWEKLYSYSVHVSTDGMIWTTLDDSNGYTLSGVGAYYILIKYDDSDVFTNLFELYMVEILNSDSVSYSFFVDDHEVSPTPGFKYTDLKGEEHYTVYVLSVAYNEKDSHVTIIPNEEKKTVGLDSPRLEYYQPGNPVRVEIYTYDSTNAKGATFAVIYIGKTDTVLQSLGYVGQNGLTEDLLQPQRLNPANPPNIIVEDANFNTLKLSYSNYWGIKENSVNIEVQKLFDGEYRTITAQSYQDSSQPDVNYVLLTRTGSYRFKFFDSCETPNVHLFGESPYIYLNFISSVPFTISYVDPISGEPTVSEPINRAIYNGDVTLTLTNPTSYFTSVSGYPVIHATKDGEVYNVSGRNTFTFSESGHYVIYFEATAAGSEAPLRTENYSFSIIKENESRFAFEYATYAGYYIKQILRDGVDVTRRFVEILDGNKITRTEYDQNKRPISVQYLTDLQISFFDEKTVGAVDRRFVVTIETGEQTYANITATSFTFAFRINMATPPLSISIEDGGKTTSAIQVNYNVQDIYQAVGDCRIVLPGQEDIIIDSEALTGEAERTATITAFGTGYIQVYSASGNLLLSYKVTRNHPLGVWEIIAIVIGVVAAAAIVFVAIKLRKRLKVK